MLYSDKVKEIEQKLGIDTKKLPNNLLTTHLCAICDCLSDRSGGGIVDVKALPAYEWISTPLPQKDHFGKIYFNTSLSVDEVNDLINKSVDSNGFCRIQRAYTYVNTKTTQEFIDFTKKDDTYRIDYTAYDNGSRVANKRIYHNKWFESEIDFSILQKRYETVRSDESTIDNTLISSLVSITPFKCSIDTNSIYRLPDNSLWVYQDGWAELTITSSNGSGEIIYVDTLPSEGWIGTPVPRSGYVEKVYLNTNLSSEEVERLFELLKTSDPYYRVLVWSSDNSKHISIRPDLKQLFLNGGSVYYSNGKWNQSEQSVEINTEVTHTYSGLPCTLENHLISSLISITPFRHAGETNTICRLPDGTLWMYQDGWVELVTQRNEVTVIDVSTITEIDPENNDYLYLDLSRNGEYFLINDKGVDRLLHINFGMCKNAQIGKAIICSLQAQVDIADLYSGRLNENAYFICPLGDMYIQNQPLYFKVENNSVYVRA